MATPTAPPLAINPGNLPRLDSRVRVPTYDRSVLVPAIVHIGVGGFHRAHQAVYLDDLCGQGLTGWSIVGAGVLETDAAMDRILREQGFLYSLITRGAGQTDVRVIGSLTGYVLSHREITPLAHRIADDRTRIVSLTITEGGYPVDDRGAYVPGDDGVPAVFAAIAAGLRLRRDAGAGGIAVMSCDNVMHNGATARAATLGAASEIDDSLGAWIERNVTFPNTMVDRITPVTTDEDRAFLATEYGIADGWPVVAEPFIQWVVEDAFAAGRPPWDDAGVLFTEDVAPYEILKLRLLNAGHSTLAYLAALAGHVYVDRVLADPLFARFLATFLDEEAGPTTPPAPGVDVEDYKHELSRRFANPAIGDQVGRLCLDGSSKFPKFLIPTIETQLEQDGPIHLSALALAGWSRYLRGIDEAGASFTPSADPRLDEAMRLADRADSDPASFLDFPGVFGPVVAGSERFRAAFVDAYDSLRSRGVHATLDRWLSDRRTQDAP